MKQFLLASYIAIGGGVGALCRIGLSQYMSKQLSSSFPWGTFIVNISGAFLIGVSWTYATNTGVSSSFRWIIIGGFLGGFTTFSTYSLELFSLFSQGHIKTALLYGISSTVLGVCCVFIGIYLSKQFI